jgi:hypothetical protein
VDGLPQLQRDLVSHAVDDLVGDRTGAGTRAPYSGSSVAVAAGYAHGPSDGDVRAASGGVTLRPRPGLRFSRRPAVSYPAVPEVRRLMASCA